MCPHKLTSRLAGVQAVRSLCLFQDVIGRCLPEVPSPDLRFGLWAGQDSSQVRGGSAQVPEVPVPRRPFLPGTLPTLSSCPQLLQLPTLFPDPRETAGPSPCAPGCFEACRIQAAAAASANLPRWPLCCHRPLSCATCSRVCPVRPALVSGNALSYTLSSFLAVYRAVLTAPGALCSQHRNTASPPPPALGSEHPVGTGAYLALFGIGWDCKWG